MEELKVLSLFSGIGAFEKALENLKIPYDLINYCEIDKYASKAYSIIHNKSEELNLGDINKIDETKLNNFDLMTYGFPCQDISIAGKQNGIIAGETRSGLFYEALRIAKYKKPKYLIAENVEALTSNKFKNEFEDILQCLENAGYNNYYKVINAINYIPQSRKRVYIISIRKDIDKGNFNLITYNQNNKTFYDLLEQDVDDKYNKLHIFNSKNKYKNFTYGSSSIIKLIDNGERITHRNDGNIYTLTASGRNSANNQYICNLGRVLTPVEAFKFMGFDRDDCLKCMGKISDAQLYKMAGNSIVVNVLEDIFRNLFKI